MSSPNRLSQLLLALTLALPASSALAHDVDRVAGDALEFLVPIGAYGIAWLNDDHQGERQMLRSTGVGLLLTHGAKLAFDQTYLGRRPDGSRGSFPSGHAALTASGAAFLTERYGWQVGGPAWLLTGFVAYNRVEERQHRWRDVIAGAALSYGVAKLFVTPKGATHLAPTVGPGWIGLRWERSF